MKKIILFFLMFNVCSLAKLCAQDETGFATSSDVLVGYKSKNVQTILGYDFGYRFIPGLYVGAGPMASVSFGSGESAFSVGGYAKVRYILPLDVPFKPFVDGRVGYGYNFGGSTGAMCYGVGLGLNIGGRFCIGFYCHMPNSKQMSEERYIVRYEKKYNRVDKKYYNVPIYGTREVENSELHFVPALLLSMQF